MVYLVYLDDGAKAPTKPVTPRCELLVFDSKQSTARFMTLFQAMTADRENPRIAHYFATDNESIDFANLVVDLTGWQPKAMEEKRPDDLFGLSR